MYWCQVLFLTIHLQEPLEITLVWKCHCVLSACRVIVSQISFWACILSTPYFTSLIQHGVGCNTPCQHCLMSTDTQCHGRGSHLLPLVSSSRRGMSGGDLLMLETTPLRTKVEKHRVNRLWLFLTVISGLSWLWNDQV